MRMKNFNMELFKHQKEGVEFLKGKNPDNNDRFILADAMGLGKTKQTIVALKEKGFTGALVVSPASIQINWKREIKEECDDGVVIIKNNDEEENIKWYVVSYDLLARDEKLYNIILGMIDDGKIDTLVLDEGQYIKGESMRSKAIIGGRKKKQSGETVNYRGLINKVKTVIVLTGTPIMNRPIELFPILKAIGHPLGRNKTEFAKKYCGMFWMYRIRDLDTGRTFVTTQEKYFSYHRHNNVEVVQRWPDMTGASNLDDLRLKLKGWMLRRKKEEVLDLPEKIISIREIKMDDEWKNKYDNAWEDYLDFREKNPIDDWNKENVIMAKHLVEIQKLKQVCSLSKIETIIEDVKDAVDSGEKVIIFSQYTETIMKIKEDLSKSNIGVVTLTGGDKIEERQRAVDMFQNYEDTKVFVANIKAGGVGINLTKASIVMFADMEWSPETHKQAEDRAHRIGTQGTVNVYYYVALDTIEETIVSLLNKKKDISDQVLEGNKKRLSRSSVGSEFLKIVSGDKQG